LSDQAGDYGRAEIETHKTSFSKSKRLAFLASFNPDIIAKATKQAPLGYFSFAIRMADVRNGSQR
jgi:hypothetical protein